MRIKRALFCRWAVLLLVVCARPVVAQVWHGNVPAAATNGGAVGRMAGTERLKLVLALPWRDREGLSNLLHDIYDPASPDFRHYLSAAEFAQRFGPDEAEYQALKDFTVANGLNVTRTHPNRGLLDVEGSVVDVERVLHVRMNTYRHPTENRMFHAAEGAPSLNIGVELAGLSGLDDFARPQAAVADEFKPGGSHCRDPGPTGVFAGMTSGRRMPLTRR